jgi:hypothetical protein
MLFNISDHPYSEIPDTDHGQATSASIYLPDIYLTTIQPNIKVQQVFLFGGIY